ncbi:hypothetical protein [Natrarchaeobius oligotrophus]|uniref:Uncharacterized protein n=1 Tax=Natrarchaeobius chitinivorans TaxID=1679083 RepID=A0A3N6M0F6_NATCH|nr:hypothetical protein [Natrarchaeobius chitinivorans]RQG96723.1 hypothetical protein EA472_20430 [Natrarchaeobius chitinivorans]
MIEKYFSTLAREVGHLVLLGVLLYLILDVGSEATAAILGFVVLVRAVWLVPSTDRLTSRTVSVVVLLGVVAVGTAVTVLYWTEVGWLVPLLVLIALWLLLDVLIGTAGEPPQDRLPEDDRIQAALLYELRDVLRNADSPQTDEELAAKLGVDRERVHDALTTLEEDDFVDSSAEGYVLEENRLGLVYWVRRAVQRLLKPFRSIG